MAWIESHQSLATHRKTLALRRLLGLNLPETIGYLHLLWWWALDNAPDGDLSSIDPVDIATAMQWTGDGKVIVAALTKTGFIDESGQIHDWYIYAGKLIDYKYKNALKQRKHREKVRLLGSGNGGNGHSNRDITVTSRLYNPTTVPYQPYQPNQPYQPSVDKSTEVTPLPPSTTTTSVDDFNLQNIYSSFIENYQPAFGKEPTNFRELAMIRDYSKQVAELGATSDMVRDAFREAAEHNKLNLNYVRGVLLNWLGAKDV